MNNQTIKTLMSSNSQHWNTPYSILEPIWNKFGTIDLDPASNATSIVNAKFNYDGINYDGLKESWQKGLAYCNSPYSRHISKWIKKAVEEATKAKQLQTGTEIILLGPARVDTKYFQDLVCPTADEILLWKGRLKFLGAKAPAPFPSFVAYWGHRPLDFKLAYIGKGWFL